VATILIVDDHPALRLVIKAQLSQVLGVSHILEADNGQTAIEAARQFEPDVAVLDLDIPRISGLDVIPRLKRIYPPIRILVISGQARPSSRRGCGAPAPRASSASCRT